ncbi:MAG: ABC transporter permease [Hydrogenoanaerobacterium sp.]
MLPYLKTFLRYNGLLKELVARDLKVKYRRSALGYVWSVLNPLLMMVVVATVFSYMFRFDIENYPMYLLTGQTIYNFYSESTNFAMNSIISSGSLIRKVHVPKYIFPLAKVLSSFVNLLFSMAAIFLMMFITGTPIRPAFFLFPFPLFYALLLCIGVGLIMSVLTVYFRDMLHLYSIFLTALMYFTPIFYPTSALPPFALQLIKLNPLYHLVGMFRDVFLYGNFPTMKAHFVCFGVGLVVTLIGLIIFKKNQDNFILYL